MTRSMMPRLSPHLFDGEAAQGLWASDIVLDGGRSCYERHDNIDGFA